MGVVTTINKPTPSMIHLSKYAESADTFIIVIGDKKTPEEWRLPRTKFFSLDSQFNSKFVKLAEKLPLNHYCRKNLGYVIAKESGAEWIYDTDDDNMPVRQIFSTPLEEVSGYKSKNPTNSWINYYTYFQDPSNQKLIWPRGFPLERIQSPNDLNLIAASAVSGIQQGCANLDPDVDAISRLIHGFTDIKFIDRPPLILQNTEWSPFNSQSTWFHRNLFALTYLPATCSFRVTDILRSFVASRVMEEMNQSISFHQASVEQYRNDHDLLKDFKDETFLYTNSQRIKDELQGITLPKDRSIADSIVLCYEMFVKNSWVEKIELEFLEVFLDLIDSSSTESAD